MSEVKSDLQSFPETSHPYAVRIELTLGYNIELLMKDEELRFPFAENHVIRIRKERSSKREQANFLKRISVHLEAFSTAREVEEAGKMLALSLLWVAASKRISLTFGRWTGKYPFSIHDRTKSSGLESRIESHAYWEIKPDELHAIAEEAYKLRVNIPPCLLISMEFFAAARLETTDRARFISLMTALEAVSEQQTYGDDIGKLLSKLTTQLEIDPILAGDDSEQLKTSLAGRLKSLQRESVRQAIVRTVRQHTSDIDTMRFVDEAYGMRSNILHEGLKVPDLDLVTHRLEDIIRSLYSSILGLSLRVPT